MTDRTIATRGASRAQLDIEPLENSTALAREVSIPTENRPAGACVRWWNAGVHCRTSVARPRGANASEVGPIRAQPWVVRFLMRVLGPARRGAPGGPAMRFRQWFGDMGSDMRQAVRQLAASPGFTLVATLTLALGIGVNSAIFALADAALMRPLPFGQAERLVMLWERTPTSPKTGVSPLNMRDWSLQSRSFEGDRLRPARHGRRSAADRARRLDRDGRAPEHQRQLLRRPAGRPDRRAARSGPKTTGRRLARWCCSAKPCGAGASAPTPRSSAASCG